MKNKSKPIRNALLFFMKVTLIQMLMTCTSVMLGHAIDTSGQEVLERKITLQTQNAEVKNILIEIEKKSDVKFTYRPRLIRDFERLSLNLVETPLADVLAEVFGSKLGYDVIGRQIVLREIPAEDDVEEVVNPTYVNAAQTISGRVTDETDAPVPGVNVLVKGTTVGTTTDNDGRFRLEVENENAILVFSFIGYETQEVAVGTRTTIDVRMTPDVQSLSEVVVVGYGEQKKVTVTGAVVAVTGADLQKTPAIDLTNSLAGRLPGVIAVQTNGEPGQDGSEINIRGVNTTGSSSALIVVDGVPDRDGGMGRISSYDIESISVLKDASSAIYGSRAANGVILITTKRGKAGKPEITYDFNQGWAQATRLPEMADASQYAAIMNEFPVYTLNPSEWAQGWAAIQQSGTYTATDGKVINSVFSPSSVQKYADGSDPWGHPNTDWFGDAFKTWAPLSRHSLQISGGNEDIQLYTSLGYVTQDAYYKNSATKFEQYNFRANLDAKINKYISTSINIMGREEIRHYPTQSAGSIFRMLMRGRPTDPEIWPNGLPGPDIENGQNPIVITTNATGYVKNPTDYLQTNAKIDITNPWIEGLKLTLMGAADKTIDRNKVWETPWSLYTWDKETYEADGVTPKLTKSVRSTFTDPRLTQAEGSLLNTNLTALLTYDRKLGSDHTIGILAGATREKFTGEGFFAYRRNFISAAVDQLFAGGSQQQNTGGSAYNRARLGYYGRVSYNFKEKYLVEFIWRRDGSYFFPEDKRFGFFPGILVGWNVSNEPFFRDNLPFFDYFKIRASYGQMGNDNVSYNGVLQEYAYLNAYNLGQYPIGGQVVTTVVEPVVANPDITWERANNFNVGIDATILGGRLDFVLEYFYNKRTDILIQQAGSTPGSSGMVRLLPPFNAGRVDNRGFEYKVEYNNTINGLKMKIGANGGYAKNEVVYMDEIPGAPSYQLQTGKPIGAFLAYQSDGAFLNEEEITPQVREAYSAVTSNLRPGDMKFKDVNGDGKINGDDQIRMEKTGRPNFQYGIEFKFEYRNFDLAILFQGATGGLLYLGTESGDIGNYLKYSYDNRWTIDNPSSEHPRLATRGDTYYTGGNFGNNTYFLKNTNYIRLKNVELGYNLPASIMERVSLKGLRIYVNTLNLVTWDNFEIWDPESVNGNGQYYPQSRVINTGLRLTF
jgi:TonB-dependent starch-binding outer membrane protein SusC